MKINEFDHPEHGWRWTATEVRWIESKIAEAVARECAGKDKRIAELEKSLEAELWRNSRFKRCIMDYHNALGQISRLCDGPNEYDVGQFDVTQHEQTVVDQVRSLIEHRAKRSSNAVVSSGEMQKAEPRKAAERRSAQPQSYTAFNHKGD